MLVKHGKERNIEIAITIGLLVVVILVIVIVTRVIIEEDSSKCDSLRARQEAWIGMTDGTLRVPMRVIGVCQN